MSVFAAIRKELLLMHGLVKHGETAAEAVAHEKLALLHDRIAASESLIASVSISALREIRKLASSASQGALTEIDAAIAYADKRATEIEANRRSAEAQQAQASQASVAEAAKAALAVPADGAGKAVAEDPAPAATGG